jgi:predicted lysophospholipase L1 biosynthesis ABC-type transport system permease subunit
MSAIPLTNETISPSRRSGRETKADYQTFPTVRIIRVRQMIEAVAAILGLFSASVFVAHAIDAYRAS